MSNKKVVLITGANSGLGLEVVKSLAKSNTPYEIIIGSRTLSNGEKAIEEVKPEVSGTASTFSTLSVDLESDASLEAAVKEISSKHGRLDALVNNGGANFDRDVQSGKYSIREGLNKSWNVNVTGTEVLTQLAVPLLLKSSDPRLLFVTSGTACLTEMDVDKFPALARVNGPPPAGWPKDHGMNPITYYRSSKSGLNMLMKEWHRLLGNDGVKVWAISPGFLATGLSNIGPEKLKQIGALPPHVGADFIRDVVEGKRDTDVGKVIRNKGEIQPW